MPPPLLRMRSRPLRPDVLVVAIPLQHSCNGARAPCRRGGRRYHTWKSVPFRSAAKAERKAPRLIPRRLDLLVQLRTGYDAGQIVEAAGAWTAFALAAAASLVVTILSLSRRIKRQK